MGAIHTVSIKIGACMKLLEKFMQKGSLWNYPVPRPKILYSPPFCMYGRGGYFQLATPPANGGLGQSPTIIKSLN